MNDELDLTNGDEITENPESEALTDNDVTDQPEGEAQESNEKKLPELKYTEDDMQNLKNEFNLKVQEETEKAVLKAIEKSKMTPEEQELEEQNEKLKSIEDREKQVALRELKAETALIMSEKELSNDFIDWLVGEDLESTKSNIDKFKNVFDSEVHKQVKKQMAGATPKGGNINPPSQENDPFRLKFIN